MEGQSSDDGGDGGDIDELLDEALDGDIEETGIHTDSKPSLTAAAAAEPVSCGYHIYHCVTSSELVLAVKQSK